MLGTTEHVSDFTHTVETWACEIKLAEPHGMCFRVVHEPCQCKLLPEVQLVDQMGSRDINSVGRLSDQ